MTTSRIRCASFGVAFATFVTLIPSVFSNCSSDSDIPGFETIQDLQYAMREDFLKILNGEATPSLVYHLCPGVTYYPGKEGRWIEPLADNTTIICGRDGKSEDNCVVDGGDLQVALIESEKAGYVRRMTKFRGITFVGSNGWSVAAYDTVDTTSEFSDCHWKDITGRVGIQIVYKTRPPKGSATTLPDDSSASPNMIQNTTVARSWGGRRLRTELFPGMTVVMNECSFANSWGLSDKFFFIIANAEGKLFMRNVAIHDNPRKNNGTSIAIWSQGLTEIESSSFHDNEFDVSIYNYQGEAKIELSTFQNNRGQSSIAITGGYAGISGNRFVSNIFPGSGNIEAQSGYVDVSSCKFLGTISQAEIITYGKRSELFMEYICFISGDYTFTPVFIGHDASLEHSTHIYADDLKNRNGQECVDPPGAFIQAKLFQFNYTFCFDDNLTTNCIGTCTKDFDARTCDFDTLGSTEPTLSPTGTIPNSLPPLAEPTLSPTGTTPNSLPPLAEPTLSPATPNSLRSSGRSSSPHQRSATIMSMGIPTFLFGWFTM